MNNKAIVIYYSLSGNTKKIAEFIKDKTGADIEEIQTLTPYTGDYNSIVDQAPRPMRRGAFSYPKYRRHSGIQAGAPQCWDWPAKKGQRQKRRTLWHWNG